MTFTDIGFLVFIFTPILLFNGWFVIKVDRWNNKRRDMKYLRHLHIWFPDAETIDLVAMESSDEEALNKIKEQVSERQRARKERREADRR